MLIGEICKETDLSRDTVRYYEKRGLIKVDISKSKYNNYKNYTEENLKRLNLIKKSKRFGFTLNEILELLELIDNNKASCSLFGQKIVQKVADIDQRIQELQDMKNSILRNVQDAQNNCGNIKDTDNCKEFSI